MTHVCCPSCRLRFTHAAAAYLMACPECGSPPQSATNAEGLLGFRLFSHDEHVEALPDPVAVAVAVALPVPPRSREPS